MGNRLLDEFDAALDGARDGAPNGSPDGAPPARPAVPSPAPPPLDGADAALLADAAAGLARLDATVAMLPEHRRRGWLARRQLREAMASARLDGDMVDVDDLLLAELDTLPRPGDVDLGAGRWVLGMLRSAAVRTPRQIFTPRRLGAFARLRLKGAPVEDERVRWLTGRLATPHVVREALERALDGAALRALADRAPPVAAAAVLARWHGSGAADAVAGAPGRILAEMWLRRGGWLALPVAAVATGFLGHRDRYRPAADAAWTRSLLEALVRSSEEGLQLQRRLEAAERAILLACPPRRASSLPALAALLAERPALTAEDAASALALTDRAARGLLSRLADRGVVRELTGRRSFRAFAIAL
ncbi:helix-turn-helix domain-containing protein [Azospirillum sp. ST 5-10]|uniref:helix-turn-helix domain-containing protein n=1 Tax=unclassified Azospirillum TaxID=2630922 RepID=UPI003F4A5A52